jgi:hypothetical protein
MCVKSTVCGSMQAQQDAVGLMMQQLQPLPAAAGGYGKRMVGLGLLTQLHRLMVHHLAAVQA